MPGTTAKLTTEVEAYFEDLRRIRASGGGTDERSYYPALRALMNAVGQTLRPRVFSVVELAQQGAGHPDLGLYHTARQGQKGLPKQDRAQGAAFRLIFARLALGFCWDGDGGVAVLWDVGWAC